MKKENISKERTLLCFFCRLIKVSWVCLRLFWKKRGGGNEKYRPSSLHPFLHQDRNLLSGSDWSKAQEVVGWSMEAMSSQLCLSVMCRKKWRKRKKKTIICFTALFLLLTLFVKMVMYYFLSFSSFFLLFNFFMMMKILQMMH